MRIIVVGSRLWRDKLFVRDAIRQTWIDYGKPEDVTIVHTGAPGAEAAASDLAEKMEFTVEIHDKNWEYGSDATAVRNKEIAESNADVCLVFIRNESKSMLKFIELFEKYGLLVKVFTE